MNNKLSFVLDFFQIATIIIILITGPLIASNILFIFLQLLAIVIILYAAWEMRRTKYYRVPDIGKQNELVITGIYKYIRNPMYLSQLLFTGVLVLSMFNFFRLGMFLILMIDFLLKIRYEETLLNENFKEFKNYKQNSWKLIPYFY